MQYEYRLVAFTYREPGAALMGDEHALKYWLINAFCTLFSYTGQPSIVIPCQLDAAGHPIGAKLVGRRWSVVRLMAVAQAVSHIAAGDFRRPSGY